jgi:hypothetical protein
MSIATLLNNFFFVRLEAFTAMTMKNFRDIETQFIPHRRHVTSMLQNPAG